MRGSTVVIIIIIALIVLVVLRNRTVVKNEERGKREQKWGRRSDRPISSDKMKDIAGLDRVLARETAADGSRFRVDDITWNDLGMDAVYAAADTCVSSAGEEYLYHLLRTPYTDEEHLSARRGRVAYFRNHPDDAVGDLLQLSDLGKVRDCSFAETIHALSGAEHISIIGSVIQLALLIVTILMIVFRIRFALPAFFIILIYNIVTYFRKREVVGDQIVSVNWLICLIRVAKRAVRILRPGERDSDDALFGGIRGEIEASLSALSGIPGLGTLITAGGMKGSFIDGLLDYVRMASHLDLIAFEALRSRAARHEKEITRLLCTVGEWESCIVLASWMESRPVFCRAEFCGENGIRLADASHPLLDDPVPNGLEADRGILLTGSNASGKSTFLKTAAICVLFAQTTGFAPAEAYRAPFFRLYSSMSLSDSIEKGESYYVAEIRSLKRVADAAGREGAPVICFLDEVLRGTNTVERIAASSSLLQALAQEGVTVFAATHDLELTKLLEGTLDNYHFEEELASSDVSFTYRILPGPAQTRNAISLLSRTGFDSKLTARAAAMAEEYERTGEWTWNAE
ncbi:MAG: hypothetical protein IKD88_09365 [Lachnospiraceae bacterium]|nr:hypothetical protein [Lachnospiraceae bacterium]